MRRFLPVLLVLCALLLPLSALAQAAAPLRAGLDYQVIEDGRPWQPLAGKIEVLEVFSYTCGHCAVLAPMLETWKARQRSDVRVSYIPLASGRNDMLSRGYFALADADKLGQAHLATFRAVHETGQLPRAPNADQLASFYSRQGLDGAALQRAMQSEAMSDRLAHAYRYALDHGVEGTPTLIINGRYRITGRNHQDTLRIADALIAQLRTPARR